MLVYLNDGERLYGESPVLPQRRDAVEFQAVLSGGARPWYDDDHLAPPDPPAPPCLWVHAAGSRHGWTDRPGGRCRVAVLHFSEVGEVMREVLARRPRITARLTPEGAGFVREAVARGRRLARDGGAVATLEMERLRVDLCLLALRELDLPASPGPGAHAAWKVEAACMAYRERLRESPSVESVAREVGVSPPHLRRLFQQVKGRSPKKEFMDIRLRMARSRVERGGMTLAEISDLLGFSEPAAFSRAYKRRFGVSPRKNRFNC